MQITVEVQDEKLKELARQRFDELFSNDARYRETGARNQVRSIVDDAAVVAVRQARDAIRAELPALAAAAVQKELDKEIHNAAKRGLAVLKKLFCGFDPNKMTPEQRAWLEGQIASHANKGEER